MEDETTDLKSSTSSEEIDLDGEPSNMKGMKGKTPDFENSTSSEKVHKMAYEWYKTCRDSHETCRKLGSRQSFAPSRLIDVGVNGDDSWKLCRYPEDIKEAPEYLALSYRWTQSPTVKLFNSNFEDFRHGAAIDSLPKTF